LLLIIIGHEPERKDMSKFSNGFTVGVITGALVGAAVALLYAPDKGVDLRDKISYKLKSMLDDLNETLDRLQREEAIIAQSESERVVAEAQQKAEDLIKEAEDLLKNINLEK
jgi:gas vesicle protein